MIYDYRVSHPSINGARYFDDGGLAEEYAESHEKPLTVTNLADKKENQHPKP